MAMDKIGDGLKKILLVGIGAAATTVEKSSQIIDELVKKGEITVEQGKELNKELQHNVKKTMEARRIISPRSRSSGPPIPATPTLPWTWP